MIFRHNSGLQHTESNLTTCQSGYTETKFIRRESEVNNGPDLALLSLTWLCFVTKIGSEFYNNHQRGRR